MKSIKNTFVADTPSELNTMIFLNKDITMKGDKILLLLSPLNFAK